MVKEVKYADMQNQKVNLKSATEYAKKIVGDGVTKENIDIIFQNLQDGASQKVKNNILINRSQLFENLDINGDGKIDANEYAAFMSVADGNQWFNDPDGKISGNEMRDAAKNFSQKEPSDLSYLKRNHSKIVESKPEDNSHMSVDA